MWKGINCIGPEYYGQVPWIHPCILNSIVQLIAVCSFLVLSPATMPLSCQALCCYFIFFFFQCLLTTEQSDLTVFILPIITVIFN